MRAAYAIFARAGLQRAVLGCVEQRLGVLAVVEAQDLELGERAAREDVERRGRLAKLPDLVERQAEDAAQEHAIDRVVRGDEAGVVGAAARSEALEHGPG